jgi:hypothetical protein|tara:strand:+ start:539 stop:1036 length:498 start_codon:yes stop_codon:yes gene_type:complete
MYQNPHASGYEVMRKTSGYSMESHGDLSATSAHLIQNDFPEYAGMFYHPTEHEIISSIKYKNENPGYDAGFREIQEAMQGPPMEFYIPHSISAADGVGRSDSIEIKNPFEEIKEKMSKGIIHEIQKAQEEIRGKTLIIRDLQVEETIIMKRKIRKTEILFRTKDI